MTKPVDPQSANRLERLLGGVALARLRQRLRRHFERGGAAEGVLQLGNLEPVERETLALLRGLPPRASRSARLDLGGLEQRIQAAGIALSLREALEALDGPIVDIAAQRAAMQAAWAAVLPQPCRDARLGSWLQGGSNLGLLKRLARQDVDVARALLARAETVLARLPAPGVPRAMLAAQVLGDAHALDNGRPVATLVLAALRHADATGDAPVNETDQAGQPFEMSAVEGADDALARGIENDAAPASFAAEERVRDVWARVGVLVNELARPVLVLNLPAPSGELSAPWLPGEPAYLSLRWLLREAPVWPVADLDLFVCENPNLLAIVADRLGPLCAPLVCTDGMPGAAQRILLDQLACAGAKLHCHADFDWAGLRIVNHLLRRTGARPWRMDAASYEDAARSAESGAVTEAPSVITTGATGSETRACWDEHLAPAMRRHGFIAEEALAESLIPDLVNPVGQAGIQR